MKMKLRIETIFSFLAGFTLLLAGCSGNNPTTPNNSNPTATFTATDTACANSQGTPCTSTFTPSLTPTGTPTNTATNTSSPTVTNTLTLTPTHTATSTFTNSATPSNTGTPTNSATTTPTPTQTNTPSNTATPTVTNSPTDSATSTATGTSTNTATVTSTFTITQTPTNSATFTPTGSATNSPTLTATATLTSTTTSTRTPTSTATATTTGVVFSGSVSYSGSWASSPGVNSVHIISVEFYNNSGLIKGDNAANILAEANVSVNGGSFSVTLPSPGTYYVLANYDTSGVSGSGNGFNNAQMGPAPGEPYAIVSGNGNVTSQYPAPGITFSAGVTSFTNTIIFGDQNLAPGINGPVTFTDNLTKGYTVSSTNRIHFLAYLTGTNYGTLVTDADPNASPGNYSLTNLGGGSNVAYDMVVFYDVGGNASVSATPAPSDPVAYFNNVPVSVIAVGTPTYKPVTFDDTIHGFNNPMTLAANINTTTYPVNSTHQLAWVVSNGFGGGNYQVIDAQNSVNNVVIEDTQATNYYVGLIYGLSGAGYPTGVSNLNNPHVGDIYQFYGFTGSNSSAEYCFNSLPGATNVTNPSGGVSLNATFPYSSTQPCTFTGAGGTFNYTGSGSVNSNNQLFVAVFSDSAYTQSLQVNSFEASGSRYDFLDFTGGVPSTYYVEAWYQSIGNNCENGNYPCVGNPVTQLGAFTQGTVNSVNINLTGANLYQGISLSGNLTWSGAVSLYVASFSSNGNFEALSPMFSSGGGYTVQAVPDTNNIYLVVINDTNGYGATAISNAIQNSNTGSLAGDSYAIYNNASCVSSPSFLNPQVGGTGIATTTSTSGLNWTVSTSCSF